MSSEVPGTTMGTTTFGSLSNDEKTTILFKKLMGKPNTQHTKEFFQEPGLSLKAVVASQQLWIDSFPDTPEGFPTDTAQNAGSYVSNLDYNNLSGSESEKEEQEKNKNIKKFVRLQLQPVTGANGLAYKHDDLKDAIPFNFGDGSSYDHVLYAADGKQIYPGKAGGDWIVDTDAGIVTFYNYNEVSETVNEQNPPSITFYRYVGRKGLGALLKDTPELNGAIIKGDLTVTGKIFLNGELESSDPGVIVGSNTEVKDGIKLPFLQFGKSDDDVLGAWRFSIENIRSDGQSKLLLETKIEDNGNKKWVTVNAFTNDE